MTFLFEWLTPQGVIAIGVIIGLIQQAIGSYRTARAVRVLAATTEAAHAIATSSAAKINQVSSTLKTIEEQTNGMSHRLETLAGEAGELRGRKEAEERNKT